MLHLAKEHQQDVNHSVRYANISLPRPAQVTRMGRHTIDTVFSLQHNTLEVKLEIEICVNYSRFKTINIISE